MSPANGVTGLDHWRAGMMAARLLVELGVEPEEAIHRVRRARKGAIETPSQLALVRKTHTQTDG